MPSYILNYKNRYGNKFNNSYDIIYTYDGINDNVKLENDSSYFLTIEDYIYNLSSKKEDYISLSENFDKNKLTNAINMYKENTYTYTGMQFNYTNSYVKNSYLSQEDLTYIHNKFITSFNL